MDSKNRLCDVCNQPLGPEAIATQKRHRECQPIKEKEFSKISQRKKRNRVKSEELIENISKDEKLMDKLASRVSDRINMNFEIFLGKPNEEGWQRGVMWRFPVNPNPTNPALEQYIKEQQQNGMVQNLVKKSIEDQKQREEQKKEKREAEILEQNKVIIEDISKIKKKVKIR